MCKVTPRVGDSSGIRRAQAPLQCPGKLSISPCACRICVLGWGGAGLTLGDERGKADHCGTPARKPQTPTCQTQYGCSAVTWSQQLGCRSPREAFWIRGDGIGGDPQPRSLRKIPFLTLENLFFFPLCFLILEKCHQAPN